MSEDSEPIAIEPENFPPLSHSRILRAMGIITLIASVICGIFISLEFGAGVLIGGIIAFVNYYWLKVSLKRIFDRAISSAESGEKPGFLAVSYFLRYLGVGAVIYLVYVTEIVPMVAFLLGLCVFALAIVIEGFLRILSSISKREEF
jgi:hypothetical protein